MSVLCRDYVGIVSEITSVFCRYFVGILSETMSDYPAILFAPLWSISPGRLCCQPEYHRYHVALVSVVVGLVFLYRRDNPVELPGAPSPRVGPRHLRRTPVGEPSEGSLMLSTSRCRYRNSEARTYQLPLCKWVSSSAPFPSQRWGPRRDCPPRVGPRPGSAWRMGAWSTWLV